MTANSKLSWAEVVIRDDEGLPGINISRVITLAKDLLNLKYVVIREVSGAVVSELIDIEDQIIDLKSAQEKIEKVKQFDWGDFFLFSEYPQTWIKFDDKTDYPQLIATTDITIRAVDDTYIYVYTQNHQVMETIKKKYPWTDSECDFLENLEFPY